TRGPQPSGGPDGGVELLRAHQSLYLAHPGTCGSMAGTPVDKNDLRRRDTPAVLLLDKSWPCPDDSWSRPRSSCEPPTGNLARFCYRDGCPAYVRYPHGRSARSSAMRAAMAVSRSG